MHRITLINAGQFIGKTYNNNSKTSSSPNSLKGQFKNVNLTLKSMASLLQSGDLDTAAIVLGKPKVSTGVVVYQAELTNYMGENQVIARTKEHFSDEIEWVLLDIDQSPTIAHLPSRAPQSIVEVKETIKQLFGDISYVIESSSSRMAKGSNNWHIYIPLSRPSSMKRVSYHIEYKLSQMDLLCEGLSTSGASLQRNHFCDMAVFSPERLIFEATPRSNRPLKIDRDVTIVEGVTLDPATLVTHKSQFDAAILKGYGRETAPKVKAKRIKVTEAEIRTKFKTDTEFNVWKESKAAGTVTTDAPIRDRNGNWTTVGALVEAGKKVACYSPFEPNYTHAAATFYPDTGTIHDHHTQQRIIITNNFEDRHIMEISGRLSKDGRRTYLSDIDIPTHNKHTGIIAPTGIGKFVWTRDVLMKRYSQHITILLVPTTHLRTDFGKKGFVDREIKPKQMKPGVGYVMTYDRFAIIAADLDPAECLVICDEAHELVSPKSSTYRYIYQRVWTSLLSNNWFKTFWVTATVNHQLLPVDITYDVKVVGREARPVEVVSNIKFDALFREHFVKGNGTAVVFIENKDKLKKIQVMCDSKGLKSVLVTSEEGSSDIKESLKEGDFSMYDVVLSTSVLRQGISITSPVQFIMNYYSGSGSKITPTEALQEMARDRKSNAKYILHIGKTLSVRGESEKPLPFKTSRMKAIKHHKLLLQKFTQKLITAFSAVHRKFDIFADGEVDMRKLAIRWNQANDKNAKSSVANFVEALGENMDVKVIDYEGSNEAVVERPWTKEVNVIKEMIYAGEIVTHMDLIEHVSDNCNYESEVFAKIRDLGGIEGVLDPTLQKRKIQDNLNIARLLYDVLEVSKQWRQLRGVEGSQGTILHHPGARAYLAVFSRLTHQLLSDEYQWALLNKVAFIEKIGVDQYIVRNIKQTLSEFEMGLANVA